MNAYFVAAGALMFVIGLVHSVLGEHLIFRRMRASGFIPVNGGPVLRERHVRILWASWHLVTVMGWCLAALLFWLAIPSSQYLTQPYIAKAIVVALLASSALVFIGTRGKHLGWAGLLGAAILAALAVYA